MTNTYVTRTLGHHLLCVGHLLTLPYERIRCGRIPADRPLGVRLSCGGGYTATPRSPSTSRGRSSSSETSPLSTRSRASEALASTDRHAALLPARPQLLIERSLGGATWPPPVVASCAAAASPLLAPQLAPLARLAAGRAVWGAAWPPSQRAAGEGSDHVKKAGRYREIVCL